MTCKLIMKTREKIIKKKTKTESRTNCTSEKSWCFSQSYARLFGTRDIHKVKL